MSFPHEAEPDGRVIAPHHYYQGALVVALSGDPAATVAMMTGVFAFVTMWQDDLYPSSGALLSLVALPVTVLVSPGWLVALGVLVSLDDALSHAFGWWTPLDWVWKQYLYEHV